MRFGLALPEGTFGEIAAQALAAERLGFDLVWIEDGEGSAPLVVAAALAPRTTDIRVVASVRAGPHPVVIAEEAAVADLSLGGRLVLCVGSDDPELLAETVDVLFLATAARPFRHEGPRWRIPTRLPENPLAEERIRVTPSPAQLELPIWVTGVPEVARSRGVTYVLFPYETTTAAREHWAAAEQELGPAAARLRRVAVRRLDADFEPDALVQTLREERSAWGLDVVVFELSEPADRALEKLATRVRPRVQLHELPPGIEQHWRENLNRSVD